MTVLHSKMASPVVKRKRRKKYGFLKLILLFSLCFLAFRFFRTYAETSSLTTPQYDYTRYQEKATAALHAQDDFSNLPLLLQNNPTWANVSYGTDQTSNTLWENGCGILSIAMVTSFWEQQEVSPTSILNWAGNRYYVNGQGTAWQIFSDYAAYRNWHFENLGNNHATAMAKMKAGFPLIVSVKAGTFTTSGHIMVLTVAKNGQITVYDPNDNPDKNHAATSYPLSTFQNEALNYWVIFP